MLANINFAMNINSMLHFNRAMHLDRTLDNLCVNMPQTPVIGTVHHDGTAFHWRPRGLAPLGWLAPDPGVATLKLLLALGVSHRQRYQ